MNEEDFLTDFELADHIDTTILMHRDAHFGGSFEVMLEYYRNEGRGIHPEITIERIEYLDTIERESGSNLAPTLLGGVEAERIAESKNLYKKLSDLYDQKNSSTAHAYALLIADLILTEDPEAKEEIAVIVKEGTAIVPALLELLRETDLHDRLFPGYGQAPEFAVECLGKIGDKRALITLFEQIGRTDFFIEDLAIEGLKKIGEPAKEFLLRVLKSHPLNEDNDRAAIALVPFKDDIQVAKTALELIQLKEFLVQQPLSSYLTLICEGLCDKEDRDAFMKIAQDPATSKALSLEMKQIGKQWQ